MELIRIYIKELYRDLLSTYNIERDDRINELLRTGTLGAELHNDFTLNFKNGTSVYNAVRFQTIDPSNVIFFIHRINLKDMYIEGTIAENKKDIVMQYVPNMVAIPRCIMKNKTLVKIVTFDLKIIDDKDIKQTVIEIPIDLKYNSSLIKDHDYSNDHVLLDNLNSGNLRSSLFRIMARNAYKSNDHTVDYDYWCKIPDESLSVATVIKIDVVYGMTITIKPNKIWNDVFKTYIDKLVAIPRFFVQMNKPSEFIEKGMFTQKFITYDIHICDNYPGFGVDIKSKPKILEGDD